MFRQLFPQDQSCDGELPKPLLLDDATLQQQTPERILELMFSTRSHMSTTHAADHLTAHRENPQNATKQIGKGQCGMIWALSGTAYVLKVPNKHKEEELWNDCCMHKGIEESFQQTVSEFRKDIHIPAFGDWVHPTNTTFWSGPGSFLPQDLKPNYGLLSQKIDPLPLPVRAALVDVFAPKYVQRDKVAFLTQAENKDCLVRLYLGRRVQRSSSSVFRLRNLDLTVNEMEHLRLDTMMYARAMAQALTILHWKARVDANDVEFVLGMAPKLKMAPTAAELAATNRDDPRFACQVFGFQSRSVGIWLLDFNQCKSFSEDSAGVKQLERAFFFNDPYYPRPGATDAKDVALWECFKKTYLETSASVAKSDTPTRFIEAVELEGRRRASGGSMFQ